MTYISETLDGICRKFCTICDMCESTYKCHNRKVLEDTIYNMLQREDYKDDN